MASIHKKRDSKYYHAAFYLPDGTRTLRSTGTVSRKEALKIALEFEKASELGRGGRYTENRARQTIADIFAIANQEQLDQPTLTKYLARWLERKKLEITESSFSEYANSVKCLLEFLGTKGSKLMDDIKMNDLADFRDNLRKKVSGTTTNKMLKILRGAWVKALKDGVIRENIMARLDLVKAEQVNRRAFTLPELRAVLNECDSEWRGMVLTGAYTGQRLGDIASLRWQNVDIEKGEIRFVTQKTGRQMLIPMAKPLLDYFLNLPSSDDPSAPVFPKLFEFAGKRVGTLSNQFADILARAGLAAPKKHVSTGKGRSAAREVSGLSFHCLRHFATTLLKSAGASESTAMDIIGHSSKEISQNYTHVDDTTKRAAIDQMPDITKL